MENDGFFLKKFPSLKFNDIIHFLETAARFRWKTTFLIKRDFPLFFLTKLAVFMTPNFCHRGLLEHGISCSISTEGYFSFIFNSGFQNTLFLPHFEARFFCQCHTTSGGNHDFQNVPWGRKWKWKIIISTLHRKNKSLQRLHFASKQNTCASF